MTFDNNTTLEVADPAEFPLPFGKYAGKSLCEVPSAYLRWMYRDWDFSLHPELQKSLEAYLGLPADPVIRVGNQAAQAFAQSRTSQSRPQSTRVNHHQNGHQTGLDGFRAALDRVRREAVAEFADEPELTELVGDLFSRARRALGI